ncbi:MAG: T9SS type A sorting domain-containing protein [Bacteroidia bacterium]|nr:T9SS type A sorting domain-containing protein [Bacteroidia bacterium]
MKTLLKSIILLFASSTLLAQIPNAGFENWSAVTTYSVPDGWGTLNNTYSVQTVTRANPGSPGSYYMKITSKTLGGNVIGGIAVSGVLDSMTMLPKSGFAFNQRPASLTGKNQYMIYGSSPGSLSVTLTRWDSGTNSRVIVASGNIAHSPSAMAMSWTNFTIPLTYADGNNPDSCIIVLKASGSAPTNLDYLWVDNLAFTGTVTGLKTQESFLSNVNVFPNPSADLINVTLHLKSEQKVSLELVDVTGKLIVSKELGSLQGESNQSLNVHGIAKGTYFVKVVSDKGTEVKKIIID